MKEIVNEWLREAWEELQDFVRYDRGDTWRNAAINTIVVVFGILFVCGVSVYENDGSLLAAGALIAVSAAVVGPILWANREADLWD